MIEIPLLIGYTVLGISLVLITRKKVLRGFPAGIIIMLYGILGSIFLNGDPIPMWIGLVGFILGIIQELRKKEVKKREL